MFNRIRDVVQSKKASRKKTTDPRSTNQALTNEVEDRHKTIAFLENILGNKKRENSKEFAAFSANLSEINNKVDSLKVSTNDATARITSLEGNIDRTTQWFEAQAQINTNISSRIDRIEASDANIPKPGSDRDPQVPNNYQPTAVAATHSHPVFRSPLGKAGYMPQDNQAPLLMALHRCHPFKLRFILRSVKKIVWYKE